MHIEERKSGKHRRGSRGYVDLKHRYYSSLQDESGEKTPGSYGTSGGEEGQDDRDDERGQYATLYNEVFARHSRTPSGSDSSETSTSTSNGSGPSDEFSMDNSACSQSDDYDDDDWDGDLNASCMNTLFARNVETNVGLIRCNQAGPSTTEVQLKMTLPLPLQYMDHLVPTKSGLNSAIESMKCRGEKSFPKKCNFDYGRLEDQVLEMDEQFQETALPQFYRSLFESPSEGSTDDDESERTQDMLKYSGKEYHIRGRKNASLSRKNHPCSVLDDGRIHGRSDLLLTESLPSHIVIKEQISEVSSEDTFETEPMEELSKKSFTLDPSTMSRNFNGKESALSPGNSGWINSISSQPETSKLTPGTRHGLERVANRDPPKAHVTVGGTNRNLENSFWLSPRSGKVDMPKRFSPPDSLVAKNIISSCEHPQPSFDEGAPYCQSQNRRFHRREFHRAADDTKMSSIISEVASSSQSLQLTPETTRADKIEPTTALGWIPARKEQLDLVDQEYPSFDEREFPSTRISDTHILAMQKKSETPGNMFSMLEGIPSAVDCRVVDSSRQLDSTYSDLTSDGDGLGGSQDSPVIQSMELRDSSTNPSSGFVVDGEGPHAEQCAVPLKEKSHKNTNYYNVTDSAAAVKKVEPRREHEGVVGLSTDGHPPVDCVRTQLESTARNGAVDLSDVESLGSGLLSKISRKIVNEHQQIVACVSHHDSKDEGDDLMENASKPPKDDNPECDEEAQRLFPSTAAVKEPATEHILESLSNSAMSSADKTMCTTHKPKAEDLKKMSNENEFAPLCPTTEQNRDGAMESCDESWKKDVQLKTRDVQTTYKDFDSNGTHGYSAANAECDKLEEAIEKPATAGHSIGSVYSDRDGIVLQVDCSDGDAHEPRNTERVSPHAGTDECRLSEVESKKIISEVSEDADRVLFQLNKQIEKEGKETASAVLMELTHDCSREGGEQQASQGKPQSNDSDDQTFQSVDEHTYHSEEKLCIGRDRLGPDENCGTADVGNRSENMALGADFKPGLLENQSMGEMLSLYTMETFARYCKKVTDSALQTVGSNDKDPPPEGIMQTNDDYNTGFDMSATVPTTTTTTTTNDNLVGIRSEIEAETEKVEIRYISELVAPLGSTSSMTGADHSLAIAPTATTTDTPFSGVVTACTLDTPLESSPTVSAFEVFSRDTLRGNISDSTALEYSNLEKPKYNAFPTTTQKKCDKNAFTAVSVLYSGGMRKKVKSSTFHLNVLKSFTASVRMLLVFIVAWTRHILGFKPNRRRSSDPNSVQVSPKWRKWQLYNSETTRSETIQMVSQGTPCLVMFSYPRDAGTLVKFVIPEFHIPGAHGRLSPWNISQRSTQEKEKEEQSPWLGE